MLISAIFCRNADLRRSEAKRSKTSFLFTRTLIARSGLKLHPDHVVASLDKTLYND